MTVASRKAELIRRSNSRSSYYTAGKIAQAKVLKPELPLVISYTVGIVHLMFAKAINNASTEEEELDDLEERLDAWEKIDISWPSNRNNYRKWMADTIVLPLCKRWKYQHSDEYTVTSEKIRYLQAWGRRNR